MQNACKYTCMKTKIEFWINEQDRDKLVELCKKAGYTVAETMRRAAEEKINELEAKCKKKN